MACRFLTQLVDLSPELKSACSYDLSELRAIADMGQKTGPRVVCARA